MGIFYVRYGLGTGPATTVRCGHQPARDAKRAAPLDKSNVEAGAVKLAMNRIARHDLKKTYELECLRCQWYSAPDPIFRCPSCGDALESRTDLDRATIRSIVSVTQRALVEARNWIRDHEGIEACHSASATVAAVEREARAGRLSPVDIMLVNLTGRQHES